MEKLIKIATYLLAVIGLASIVKYIHNMHSKNGCCLCGWHKAKEEEKPVGATESHKTKEEERTGSRYGSNPVKY